MSKVSEGLVSGILATSHWRPRWAIVKSIANVFDPDEVPQPECNGYWMFSGKVTGVGESKTKALVRIKGFPFFNPVVYVLDSGELVIEGNYWLSDFEGVWKQIFIPVFKEQKTRGRPRGKG